MNTNLAARLCTPSGDLIDVIWCGFHTVDAIFQDGSHEYGWPSYSQLIIITSSKNIFTGSRKKHWPKLLTIKYFYWW